MAPVQAVTVSLEELQDCQRKNYRQINMTLNLTNEQRQCHLKLSKKPLDQHH